MYLIFKHFIQRFYLNIRYYLRFPKYDFVKLNGKHKNMVIEEMFKRGLLSQFDIIYIDFVLKPGGVPKVLCVNSNVVEEHLASYNKEGVVVIDNSLLERTSEVRLEVLLRSINVFLNKGEWLKVYKISNNGA